MRALLISTYELGRQPFGLASPAAWLRARGWEVACADLAKERLSDDLVRTADLVGVHLQMHTATRLAAPVIARVRAVNPRARLCAYGLYAPLNEAWLQSIGVNAVFGGEFEGELTEWAEQVRPKQTGPIPRLRFLVPDRSGLPPLSRYAMLTMADGSRRTVGSTEASRGCRHLCRHCPVVPVYDGQFRVVPVEVVLADVDQQVAAGASHITFGDPDFFNGPTHALRIVEGLHAAHPHVTYDVTVKVEHLLRYRDRLVQLAATGCLFVTSAVESVDDRVLAILQKGHTRADFVEASRICRDAGLTLVPTFVAFHPWLSLDDYCELLDTITALDLVGHVAPIQLAIRLLLPSGSRLLEAEELAPSLGPYDAETLSYRWTHPDARVDALQAEVMQIVSTSPGADRGAVFARVRALAYERAGRPAPPPLRETRPAPIPVLNEPWYCCAEPQDIRLV